MKKMPTISQKIIKKSKIASFVFVLISNILLMDISFACTDFRTKAKDGSVIITRTMEFAVDLKSNLRTSTQGTVFTSSTSEGKPGLTWKAKYGYVYLDGLNIATVVDGMNEKGLSFEYLYLPGETQYPTAAKGEDAKVLSYYQLGDWILGNFETIEEVKKALANVIVVNSKIPGMGDATFPLHASIYDASGKGIVIEFVEGKMNIHDNELGILTNSPTYPWHVTNLRNYINLSPYNPNPVVANDITFNATGQGAGMIGMPGDVSPPSRFVKIAILLRSALEAVDAAEALNLSQHIINNVDIPAGLVRVKGTNGQDSIETTQWTVFKDLTNKVFYYRTYEDLGLRAISLDKLNFSKDATLLKMPISGKPVIRNITEEFKKQ